MDSKTVVLIPAYEPDGKMLNLIDEIKFSTDYDVAVVNDGSSEKKDFIFNEAQKKATLLVHNHNMGKGAALKTGLEYINAHYPANTIVCMADADGQHTPADIKRVCEKIAVTDGIVIGGRKFCGKVPLKSRLGNKITRGVFRMVTGCAVNDTQTGLRGFKADKIPYMTAIDGNRYEYEMNVLLECARDKIPVTEIPIETVYIDDNASSHFNPIKDSWRIYKQIIKFAMSSLIGFVVDFLMYSILFLATKNLAVSNIGARAVSSAVNFSINKKFVFKSKENILHTAVKYYALAVCILAVNTCLLELLSGVLGINEYIGKVIVEVLMFVISWSVQQCFVFSRSKGKRIKREEMFHSETL